MRGANKSKAFFIFIVFIGAILGNMVGDFLGNEIRSLQFLKNVYTIGTPTPININMKILDIVLGIKINFNIMSIFGIILAIILYRKY